MNGLNLRVHPVLHGWILLVILLCSVLSCTALPQAKQNHSSASSDGFSYPTLFIELASILPLHGEYIGTIEDRDSATNTFTQIGVVVKEGVDRLSQIGPGKDLSESPNDILVEILSPFLISIHSSQSIDLNLDPMSGRVRLSLLDTLKSGRRVRIKEGTAYLIIAEPKGKKQIGLIEYTFGKNAVIEFDKSRNTLSWSGFSGKLKLIPKEEDGNKTADTDVKEKDKQDETDKKNGGVVPTPVSCEEDCRMMFNKGELKKGMTIEQCIEILCKQ